MDEGSLSIDVNDQIAFFQMEPRRAGLSIGWI
jgi:hypothetical protein